jgi:hypothetical protein
LCCCLTSFLSSLDLCVGGRFLGRHWTCFLH